MSLFFDLVREYTKTTSVFFFSFLPACCPLVVRLLSARCPLAVRSLSTSTVNSHFRFCADFASAQTCTFVHVRSVHLTLVSVLTFLFPPLWVPPTSHFFPLFKVCAQVSDLERARLPTHAVSRSADFEPKSILTDSRCFHDIPIVLSPCYLDHSVRFTC
jgi:hypothetical protein